MTPIVVFGAGGFGREVQQLIDDISHDAAGDGYEMLGWLDGDRQKHGTAVADLPVLGDEEWLSRNSAVLVVVAVGSPAAKRAIVGRIRGAGHDRFATLIHPTVQVGARVTQGEGSIVCAGTILTTDITIGAFTTINLMCTIGHDAVIEDYTTLAPSVNISGRSHINAGVEFGTGAATIPGTSVGAGAVIGAGAVVIRDIPAGETAVGVPAKVLLR